MYRNSIKDHTQSVICETNCDTCCTMRVYAAQHAIVPFPYCIIGYSDSFETHLT